MTYNQQWKRAIKACSFTGLIPEVTVHYADGPYDRPYLVTQRFTPDVVTGDMDWIAVVYDLTVFDPYFPQGYTQGQMAGIIYRTVCGNLSHEAAEFFRFHGEAIFYPHVKLP